MIKIGPLLATDYAQVSFLLDEQVEPALEVTVLTNTSLVLRSLAFWQHWVPCQFHVTPSIYVAREEGLVLGFISLHHMNKTKSCWSVDNLVVHPDHRGRGIAHELLRYAFALFGSQGVAHFVAEVPARSDAALSLFAGGGFCRSAQITYYKLEASTPAEPMMDEVKFRIATQLHKHMLYQVHQDVLPPDLRLVLSQSSEDFAVKDLMPFTSVERKKNRLMRTRVWYWIGEDVDRKCLTSAVKVTAQPGVGYKLEFAVHPGWKHITDELVKFAVAQIRLNMPQMPIWARVYDFHSEIHESLQAKGFERVGDYFLLTREHWQRAKRLKRAESTVLKPIANPALNLPLATERN